ncbi:uncharacterized protein DC041_0009473 [Schistosoma bovis]|uniref:Uncharacterized protein n=1 Tax=Schistosoma bovis TaxID=6184 RepID=A0A430QPD8_SCHBO|nr:uncharacterized protein DC041_0009473 [Schistosoma bovis]
MQKNVNILQTPNEQLTKNETMINESILNCLNKDNSIFQMLCKCIAFSRMIYEIDDWHHAQYQCCFEYALQAESHAENSMKLISLYLNSTSQQMNQQNSDDHANLIILCIVLLNYYTLAKSKIILKNLENIDNYEDNSKQFDRYLENYYQQWNHCTLIRLDKNFYPNLQNLKVCIYCLYGKIAFECEKYVVSFDQYMQALKFIEKTYGPESKETISVYHALAHIEYQSSEDDMEKSIDYFKKAYEISNKIYYKEESFSSMVDLIRSVYLLCTVYMKLNLNLDDTEHLLGEMLQMLNTYNEKNNQNSIEYHVDNNSNESVDLMRIKTSSLDNDNHHIKCLTDQCLNSIYEYSDEYFVNLICSLRSLLIKIYIKSNRFQEALKLLEENLNIQEDTFGMYSTQVIKTYKLILSINMVQENFAEAFNQAEMCLDPEQFTFGANSKQAKRTKDILNALSRLARTKFYEISHIFIL